MSSSRTTRSNSVSTDGGSPKLASSGTATRKGSQKGKENLKLTTIAEKRDNLIRKKIVKKTTVSEGTPEDNDKITEKLSQNVVTVETGSSQDENKTPNSIIPTLNTDFTTPPATTTKAHTPHGTPPNTPLRRTLLPTPSHPLPVQDQASSQPQTETERASDEECKESSKGSESESDAEPEPKKAQEERKMQHEHLMEVLTSVGLVNRMIPGGVKTVMGVIIAEAKSKPRIPAEFTRDLIRVFTTITDVMEKQFMELRLAEAKQAVWDEVRDLVTSKTSTHAHSTTVQDPQPTTSTTTLTDSITRSYAAAVSKASTTLIIKTTEDRTGQDIKNQIAEVTKKHHHNITQVKHINKGIQINCTDTEHAEEIKKTLAEAIHSTPNITVQNAQIKKKKIMLFNVPEHVSNTDITNKLATYVGLHSRAITHNNIMVLNSIPGRETHKHVPVLLPEPLADHILKEKTLCLGFKECPVKLYIQVTRCHKCNGYDHIAAHCTNEVTCMKCAGTHDTRDCTAETLQCINCTLHNEKMKDTVPRYIRNERHAANDKGCWVYRTLFAIRQVEAQTGTRGSTKGSEVINGYKWINDNGPTPRIIVRDASSRLLNKFPDIPLDRPIVWAKSGMGQKYNPNPVPHSVHLSTQLPVPPHGYLSGLDQ